MTGVLKITQHITRAQHAVSYETINSASLYHAKEKVTWNIQRIPDKRVVTDLGRDQIPEGYKATTGTDKGDASITERIQAWPVRDK